MLEKAIAKLKTEIDGNKNNPNLKVVGEFLLRQLKSNNAAAEKVVQEDKTIKGSIDKMKETAKTNAVDGCGMLTDEEGFGIVLKYFDIKFTPVTDALLPIKVDKDPVAHIAQNKKPDVDFNVELDF